MLIVQADDEMAAGHYREAGRLALEAADEIARRRRRIGSPGPCRGMHGDVPVRAAGTLRVGARARPGAPRELARTFPRSRSRSDPSGTPPYAGRVSDQLPLLPAAGVPAHARLGWLALPYRDHRPCVGCGETCMTAGSPAHPAALPRLPRRTAPHARPVTAVTSPPRPPRASQRTRGCVPIASTWNSFPIASQGTLPHLRGARRPLARARPDRGSARRPRRPQLRARRPDRRPDRARRGRSQRALLRAAPEGRRLLVERGSHVDALRRRRSGR